MRMKVNINNLRDDGSMRNQFKVKIRAERRFAMTALFLEDGLCMLLTGNRDGRD